MGFPKNWKTFLGYLALPRVSEESGNMNMLYYRGSNSPSAEPNLLTTSKLWALCIFGVWVFRIYGTCQGFGSDLKRSLCSKCRVLRARSLTFGL